MTLFKKRGRGENESELVDAFQLLTQFTICVHGKHRRSDGDSAACFEDGDEVVFENVCAIVEKSRPHGLRTGLSFVRTRSDDVA